MTRDEIKWGVGDETEIHAAAQNGWFEVNNAMEVVALIQVGVSTRRA